MKHSFKSFIAACLALPLLPSLAFAWGGGMSNASASNSTLSIMSASGSGSANSRGTTFTYTSSVHSVAPAAQTVSPAIQSILNSINVSANPGLPSATVKQGLNDALTFNNNLLQGNDEKNLMIAPLTSILLSTSYDNSVKTLALQNLESIAKNDRININDKLPMVETLFTFTEQSIANKTLTQDNLFSFENSLKEIIDNKNTPQETNDAIATRLFADESPFWTDSKAAFSGLSVLENYLRTENSDLTYKKTIIDYLLTTISGLDQTSKASATEGYIFTLGAALQDSRLDSGTKTNIATAVQNVFNQITPEFMVKRTCLGVLMIAKGDTAIDQTTRNSISNTIVTQGVTTQNQAIWDKYEVLVLVEPAVAAQVNDSILDRIDNALAAIPADKRPLTISLQSKLNDSIVQSKAENKYTTGCYEDQTQIIFMKTNEVNNAPHIIEETTFHETAHYVQYKTMTTEQEQRWDALWELSTEEKDFANEYGATNKEEDRSMVMEYMFLDRDPEVTEEYRLLPRAQAQAQAGDTTLLDKYNLAKEIWGVS